MSTLSIIKADLSKFAGAVETDAEKFAKAFEKIFNKLPSAEQAISNFIGEVAPEITLAVSLADPLAEPAVAGALSIAETGLAAIAASTAAAQSGTSLVSDLKNFSASVPKLLIGLQIKNPLLQAAVARIVSLVTGELAILIPLAESWVKQLAVPQPPPASPATAAA